MHLLLFPGILQEFVELPEGDDFISAVFRQMVSLVEAAGVREAPAYVGALPVISAEVVFAEICARKNEEAGSVGALYYK